VRPVPVLPLAAHQFLQAKQFLQPRPVLREALVVLVGGRRLAPQLAGGELGGVNDFQGAVRVRGEGRVAGEDLLRAAALSGAEAPLQLGRGLTEWEEAVTFAAQVGHGATLGEGVAREQSRAVRQARAPGRQFRILTFRTLYPAGNARARRPRMVFAA